MVASGRSNGHDLGPEAFVHLDVVSAFSRLQSPSTPRDYVSALAQQFPLNERTANDSRPALAICDWGLQSAVKTAVACHRAGVDHLLGLRLRLVPEAAWHPWAEQPRELLLIAGDDEAWLALVALSNLAHLSNADFRGPRVDWRDLEQHCRGELICLTGAPMVGVLSPLVENAADPSNPIEAVALTRRLAELFPHLYIELAYHHHPREKLINRGLVALAQRLDLPLVATNAVRFARKQDALTSSVLEAIGRRRRAGGVIGSTDGDESDVPVVSVDDAYRAQAYLKSPTEMHRLFAQLPAALNATAEIRALAKFRLPLAVNTPPEQRYGPARLFGLDPVRDMDRQRLNDLVERALPERFAETGRGEPSAQVREQAATEALAICDAGLAELLLVAYDVGQFCKQHGIPLSARGSATCSLVAWVLGLVELCPLDHGLDAQLFVHQGRGDLPDLDLEVSSVHEPAVSAFVARYGSERLSQAESHNKGALPRVGTLRLGINVSFGARQAVRSVGVALGVDPIRINSLARQVPLLSSPGAVEQVLTRSPEMGGSLSASSEPGLTILRVAGRIEGLPQRFGAHPSAYAVSFHGPGALSWLPAHWVSADRPGRSRFGGPRHLAMGAESRPEQAELAHPSAVAPNDQLLGGLPGGADDQDDTNPSWSHLDSSGNGPVLACAWDKRDYEDLGVPRLDISTSAAMPSTAARPSPQAQPPDDIHQAAWRMLEAADTRCLSQVESPGFQGLLRRVREASRETQVPLPGPAINSLEDLAQLLALWRPGAFSKTEEQSYLAVRFGGQRPTYFHPALNAVLDPTHGVLLYGDQVAAMLRGLGFEYEWADRFRRALATGQRARRIDMERELKSAAQQRRWTEEQINGLLGLLQEHTGYLYAHGHALALAQHVLTQACAKVNPETAAAFFCDVLNNGGSAHYGLGAAVEEARRWGVVMLGPCVNRSTDRFAVDNDALESTTQEGKGQQSVGAIRVPLTAIRGLGAEAARHIIAMRTAFGSFTSLLDFRQRIERGMLDRRGLLALIKLGAFDFTALPRAQLAMAEQVYSATADLLLASDRHPAAIAPLEEGLTELVARAAGALEWPPEVLAADELAFLGFYVGSDLHKHATRIAEEFSTIDIAQLGGHPHNAPVSIAGLVTSLRVRQTKKGEEMAWLSISDASGSVSCAIFPSAYQRLGQPTVLREGAFLVARGRLAHEEATGTNVWVDSIVALSGAGTHLRALATAVDHQADRART